MNRFPALLACLAMIVTTMVPSGFMAAQAADGTITIRVCNAGAANSPKITPDHPLYETYLMLQQSEHGSSDTDPDEEPCDMGTAPIADMAGFVLTLKQPDHHTPQSAPTNILTGLFPSGLPPSTGPPAS